MSERREREGLRDIDGDDSEETDLPDGISDLEPIDLGEETNVAEDLDEMLYGY